MSGINVIIWFVDSNKTDDIVKDIEKIADIKEVKDDGSTEIIVANEVDEDNPYWDYIKMNMIDVNFDELHAMFLFDRAVRNILFKWILVVENNFIKDYGI